MLFGNSHAQDRAALERYAWEAGKLGVSAAPTMYANGKSVAGPYGVDELAQLLREASR